MCESSESPAVDESLDSSNSPQITPPSHPIIAIAVKEESPARWRELLVILVFIVLCDLTIYRGQGFAGYALLMAVAPILLFLGSPWPRWKDDAIAEQPSNGRKSKLSAPVVIIGLMLLALAAKLVWCGSVLQVAVGFALIAAFAAAAAGVCPCAFDVLVLITQIIPAGFLGLKHYERSVSKRMHRRDGPAAARGSRTLSVLLPLIALAAFGMLFILANPDLLREFSETLQRIVDEVREWLMQFSPSIPEVLIWIGALWASVGLLRPIVGRTLLPTYGSDESSDDEEPGPAPLYAAMRNTLLMVVVLFVVYLVFEFRTVWFQKFPEGFYYSGYAHEGAAWLTAALALSTAVLSMIFRGRVLRDPRVSRLRGLAWFWSLENIVLALAVYNRLFIYIDFNGMTRMRVIGLYGMSAVVVGFILVVWKIIHNRDFVWLVRRHLWTVAVAVYLLAITPVDAIVTSYNVRRILAGDPAPSVQISVHPMDSQGIPYLEPLFGCDDEIIREGIRAMLAERQLEAEAVAARREYEGWTAFQLSDRITFDYLKLNSDEWRDYRDPAVRDKALQRFHDYAYQWY